MKEKIYGVFIDAILHVVDGLTIFVIADSSACSDSHLALFLYHCICLSSSSRLENMNLHMICHGYGIYECRPYMMYICIHINFKYLDRYIKFFELTQVAWFRL